MIAANLSQHKPERIRFFNGICYCQTASGCMTLSCSIWAGRVEGRPNYAYVFRMNKSYEGVSGNYIMCIALIVYKQIKNSENNLFIRFVYQNTDLEDYYSVFMLGYCGNILHTKYFQRHLNRACYATITVMYQ